MRPDFTTFWKLFAFFANERSSCFERGQQLVLGDVERGEMHGGGEHVVGGLAHVDVVVRVGAVAGELGDHLVGVRVRRGARARLEDVDRELRVVLARGDLLRGFLDFGRGAFGQQTQLAVDGGRGALDAREPVHDRQWHGLARDREVLYGLGGLSAPELLVGHMDLLWVGPEPYPQNATSSRASPTGSS